MVGTTLNHTGFYVLTLVLALSVFLLPNGSCHEANSLRINAAIDIDDIDFKQGNLHQSAVYISINVNTSFCIVLFSPSPSDDNIPDARLNYSNGHYYLSRQYYSDGLEIDFFFGEWTFINDRLECGLVIGIDVTTDESTLDLFVDLDPTLRKEWEANGDITKVSEDKATRYVAFGISTIRSEVRNYDLKELFLLKVQIIRKLNAETVLNWLLPTAVLCFLLASVLIMLKVGVAISPVLYLYVAFPTIAHLSFLNEITPPLMTSIEWLTVSDITLCFAFAIATVVLRYKRREKETEMQKETRNVDKKHAHELAEYAKLIKKERLLKDNAVLIEYWKKVKETIHLFDEIIVKYVIQWSAVLLAIVGASTLVFSNSTPEVDFSFLAGMITLTAILISIPIAVKCYFYYELLEEALNVAKDVESIIFGTHTCDIRLTHRLTRISTKERLGIKYFAWTILIPFALLFVISFGLMLYYFSHLFR